MEKVNIKSLSEKVSCTFVSVHTCTNPDFDGDGTFVGPDGEHLRTNRCQNSKYFNTQTYSFCTNDSDDCNGCYYFDGTVAGGDPTMTSGSNGITATPESEYDPNVVVTGPIGFQNMFVALAEIINDKLKPTYVLSPTQLGSLVSFPNLAIEINEFLDENNESLSSKKFVFEATKAVSDHGELDIVNRLIYSNEIGDRILRGMSQKEREIFDNELDNTQKFLYLKSAGNAWAYSEIFYDNPVRNRKGDAVRHSMWNALSASRIGVALIKN